MEKIILFCKSYDKDMLRARRMAESVLRFNVDSISLYFCVPAQDLAAFQECLGAIPCFFLTDEDILFQTSRRYGELPKLFPFHLMQQLMKLEFWRMGLCENYVWLDSDSYFIRPFSLADFFADGQTPYTVMHDNSELLDFARRMGRQKISDDFKKMASRMQEAFGRVGDVVDFGYPPLIWSSKVLQSLDEYLRQHRKTIYDLLMAYPCEMQIYGEYLLFSKVIPLIPKDPLFKFYHYAEQFYDDQERGESDYSLAVRYAGVVIQSNWARVPGPKRPTKERLKRFFQKVVSQIRGLFLC